MVPHIPLKNSPLKLLKDNIQNNVSETLTIIITNQLQNSFLEYLLLFFGRNN